ncbi:MAG TPA: ubiquinol-cytochrome C chaperone family protein [Caulobacteraceae bacterium]|jgi:cytochrome b pre-mRNA-processing protein 3|nr:ubiquinol-cytochrome C chaperone family protein [Caulobacteraceae bacterium]
MQAIRQFFAPRAAVEAGRRLYVAASAHARQPALYLAGGVADTPEGRFELYTLHVVLVLHRLKGQGSQAAEVAQALFDAYVKNLDHGLREMGVGDLSVGKKMRKLGEAFYGRAKAYDEALARLPDAGPLRALIDRTVLEGRGGADSGGLTAYVMRAAAALGAQPLDEVLGAQLNWPNFEEPHEPQA